MTLPITSQPEALVPLTFVYVFQRDGSLVVWDLRESDNVHKYHTTGHGASWVLRYPTYNTGTGIPHL